MVGIPMAEFTTAEILSENQSSVLEVDNFTEEGISGYAFSLLMVAALLHGLWNLAARKVKGDGGVFLCSIIGSVFWLAPFAALLAPLPSKQNCIDAMPFVIATGLLHAVYIYLVGAMYAHAGGDVSMVYPIARGTGVTITAVMAGPLLQEAPTRAGWMGIATVVVGIWMISQKPSAGDTPGDSSPTNVDAHRLRSSSSSIPAQKITGYKVDEASAMEYEKTGNGNSIEEGMHTSPVPQHEDSGPSAVTLALLTGCCISSYSLCDKMGLHHMHPTQYILGMNVVNTLSYAPMALRTPNQRKECWAALQDKKKYIAVIGCGSSTSYLIVLYALSFTKASYVVAIREVSILFGALLGIIFLKEPLYSTKIVGGALVVGGLITIKILG
eukprot:m.242620 g.242620  ORF g.242620 m.242620 type:complete len:384 (+) comp19442_c2_seq25:234-1385(+)